jgi:hypothetical protein
VATDEVESTLGELDQMILTMAGSQMVSVMNAMPDGLVDISGIFDFQNSLVFSAVQNDFHALQKTVNDTSIANLIELLTNLLGTHTWDGSQWVHSGNPDDEVVIVFPYEGSGTEQTVTIRLYELSISNSNLAISAEIYLDEERIFSVSIGLTGSNFYVITGEPTVESVSVEGTILDSEGIEYEYSVTVTDDKVVVTIGPTGENQLTINVEGSGFIDSVLDDQDPSVTKITIEYASVTMVIDDPDADSGDIGDILYNGVKVADLVIKDDELYIVYINDEEKLFSQVMTSFALLSQIY